MRGTLTSFAAALLLVCTTIVQLRADEEKIALDKLPKAVKAALKEKYPDAELVSAEKETDKGKTYYEVVVKDKKKNVEVTLTEDGKIVAVERQIEAKDLPKSVTDALDAKYPKATIKKVEEVTKGDKVTYEIAVETADKKMIEVEFDSKGKIVEPEKDK